MRDKITIVFGCIVCAFFLIAAAFSAISSEFCDVYYRPMSDAIFCTKLRKNTTMPMMPGVEILSSTCDPNLRSEPLYPSESLPFTDYIQYENCSLHSGILTFLNLTIPVRFISEGNMWDVRLVNDTFSGLCGLKELFVRENAIKAIEPLAFRCLHQIEMLYLHKNEIEFFPVDVFKNMVHLKLLDISSNRINVLPVGLFDSLVSLNTLRLHSNSISHFPEEDIFRQLTGLVSLDVSQNELKYLNLSIFKSLTLMTTLRLDGNKLEELTSSLYSDWLSSLNISGNEGLHLNSESIAGLFQLYELDMTNCKLTTLPTGFFTSHRIHTLKLDHNSISEITPELLGSLRHLEELYLSYNDVAALKNQPFRHNSELRIISLYRNKLSIINESYFKNLQYLAELDLSHNRISNLAYNSFHSLPDLKSLNVSHNNIYSWPASQLFGNNTRLKTIDLSYNRLTDLSGENWRDRSSIIWFWATDNLITELIISLMPPSSSVHLERNKVRRVYFGNTSRRFQTKSLVYLQGNPLDCDCHTYGLYKALKEKSLSRILFEDFVCQVPPHLNGRKLEALRPAEFVCGVTDYCPRNCDCFRRAYDNVHVVNCSSGGYVVLPHEVPLNTNILDVAENNLTSLGSLGETAWENLTVLRAEDNIITSEDFYVPRNLRVLGLKGNGLHTLPETVQRHAENAKDFNMSLSNNPWPCDCRSLHFKKFILDHSTQVLDATDIHCIFINGSWSSSSLITMDDFDLCPSFLGAWAVYSATASLVIIVSSLVMFYYRNKSHILCYLYTQCSRWYLMLCCYRLDSEDKTFDCFISYSAADADVAYAILEMLENNPPHFTFCIHERNWMAGQFITNNIIQSVQNSRKTIIILSEAFAKSEWFHLEFQAAYYQMLKDRKDRLILVLKGDLPDKSELDKDVQCAIAWRTYLQWEERWFWEKLRRSIWEQSAVNKERSRDGQRGHCKVALDVN